MEETQSHKASPMQRVKLVWLLSVELPVVSRSGFLDISNRLRTGTGLIGGIFNSLIFNTFNIPHLHEMDFTAFVKRWADEGQKMGTTKDVMDGDRGESSSKVVRRHLEQK
jgi:hypothetical protein